MVTFRFYGPLNDFLSRQYQQRSFTHPVGPHATIKDVIESFGVPHPEIGLLLVNSQPVDFAYRLRPNDQCSAYPYFYTVDVSSLSWQPAQPAAPLRFVLDTHLGKLATYLRLLGIDTLYRNSFADPELADISSQENRVLLIRDRGLLMRSVVQYGYFVRHTQPTQQLQEIIERYSLNEQAAPFSRCLVCNGELISVSKEEVLDQLPPHVQMHQHSFFRCYNCGKAFWKGSHYKRMEAFIDGLRLTGASAHYD